LRKGTILTKEMILHHLYGGIDEPEIKIIDVFVCKLRKKLTQATGGHHYIDTIWGRGYVLQDPAIELATTGAGIGSESCGAPPSIERPEQRLSCDGGLVTTLPSIPAP
jgi:two-component system cell cycle response regulator CtrA